MEGLHTEKRFPRPLPVSGERVWYQKPMTEGKDELGTRWEHGIFAGVREESGELLMLTEAGAAKVRGFKRRSEEERLSQEGLSMAKGVPWEPVPGRAGTEVKAKFLITEDDEVTKEGCKTRGMKPRRIYIAKEDVKQSGYGWTVGCRGCEAANRGLVGIHDARRRN